MNLIVNARDAMPEGGLLTIETRNAVVAARQRGFGRSRARGGVGAGEYVGGGLDTGTGISAKPIDRIFEPFFTTKGPGGGSGLGLSMVYGFVKQSGGYVNVDSELGHGTTVALYLPKSREAQPASAERTDVVLPGIDEDSPGHRYSGSLIGITDGCGTLGL